MAKKTSAKKEAEKKVTDYAGTKYKNGQLKAEIIGEDLVFYFVDGTVKAKGPIKDDRMEGPWTFYKKGGILWQTGYFKQDIKNGEFITYDSKGEVAYHVRFEDGKEVEKLG